MCGLFGFATTNNVKNLPGAFLVLALENQSRGRDSWGVSNGKELIRHLGTIERQWHKIAVRSRGVMMGHVRAATVGKVSVENCHPFEIKAKNHVIGAHNGHVSNWQELNKEYNRELEVDSMQIFAHLAEDRPMDEIQAAGAITFLKNGGLFFSRFNGGSLSIAQMLDEEQKPIGLAWSSLECDLRKALDGAGITHMTYKVEEGHIYNWDSEELVDTKQIMTIRGYSRPQVPQREWPAMNKKQPPYNSAPADKRIVRLRVTRHLVENGTTDVDDIDVDVPETTPDPKPAETPNEALERIKTQIAAHEALWSDVNAKIGFCCKCGMSTTRVRFDNQYACLPCSAHMVMSGELIITETSVEKVRA